MLVLEQTTTIDGAFVKAHCSTVLSHTHGIPYLYIELPKRADQPFRRGDSFWIQAVYGLNKERTSAIVETMILHSAFAVYEKSI